jgi:hypothetical protein
MVEALRDPDIELRENVKVERLVTEDDADARYWA